MSQVRRANESREVFWRQQYLLGMALRDLQRNPENEESEILGLENIDVGIYGVMCGSLDADALVRAYETEFLKLGREIYSNTPAKKLLNEPVEPLGIPGEPFVWQESRIAGVETSKGKILAETTVVATGTWAEELFNPIGYDCFMRPKKRQLFAFKENKLKRLLNVKGLNESNILPLIILPRAGIYLKGEKTEGSIWLGGADDIGRKFECEDDPQPEEEYYSNNIYHVLVQYLPCFEDVRPHNAWAGQYDINSFDKTPVVEGGTGFMDLFFTLCFLNDLLEGIKGPNHTDEGLSVWSFQPRFRQPAEVALPKAAFFIVEEKIETLQFGIPVE